jgi:hypothetical protein
MNKTHDKTSELPGTTKVVRAISSDLVYQGGAIRGRQRTRIDGPNNSYEIFVTEGEIVEGVDQGTSKDWVTSGRAELLSGGRVTVTDDPKDGFPTYQSWVRDPSAPEPVFEKCELLKPMWFGDGCLLEKGSKVRLDISTTSRTSICYEDDQQNDSHTIRIPKLSPKKVRISQAETAGKVNAIFAKMFPATT